MDKNREQLQKVVRQRWAEQAAKINALVAEFPAAEYEIRITSATRTLAQELRHVAFWNLYAAATLRQERADGDGNELPAERYATAGPIRTALTESFDAVTDALDQAPAFTVERASTAIAFLEHNAEHYGQLVAHCRRAGRVPPASRS
jgi:uncharacterized damage-inducible protein DinB